MHSGHLYFWWKRKARCLRETITEGVRRRSKHVLRTGEWANGIQDFSPPGSNGENAFGLPAKATFSQTWTTHACQEWLDTAAPEFQLRCQISSVLVARATTFPPSNSRIQIGVLWSSVSYSHHCALSFVSKRQRIKCCIRSSRLTRLKLTFPYLGVSPSNVHPELL